MHSHGARPPSPPWRWFAPTIETIAAINAILFIHMLNRTNATILDFPKVE